MGRPPAKLVTVPDGRRGAREDHLKYSELVPLEQSWMRENPGAGKEAFYRWYAESYYGLSADKIGRAETEQVRQLFRKERRKAREAGWLAE